MVLAIGNACSDLLQAVLLWNTVQSVQNVDWETTDYRLQTVRLQTGGCETAELSSFDGPKGILTGGHPTSLPGKY